MWLREVFDVERRRNLAIVSARLLVEKAAIKQPPVDVDRLARLVGVRRIMEADLRSVEACLLPDTSGHLILIKKSASEGRKRFSIAHEIAHVLLRSKGTKFRLGSAAHRSTREERLCNVLAAELLMPLEMFQLEAQRYEASLGWITELARIFQVAIEAAAWRFAETTSDRLEIIRWGKDDATIFPEWIAGSEIVRSWCDVASLARPSDAYFGPGQAFHSERLLVTYERPTSQSPTLRFESKRFGRRDRYVLSMVREPIRTREAS